MARKKYGKTRTIPYRRKREGRTSYKRRLGLLKSADSRLVIRKSLNTITTQIITYSPDGDKVAVSATSQELRKMGWKLHGASLPAAYLTGLLLGAKAKKMNIAKAILDFGLQSPRKKGRLFAAVKGAVDAGLDLNCDDEAFPSDERVSGKHIAEYAGSLKQDNEKYSKQFSRCIKQGANPEDFAKVFEETKSKILAI
jgi:large subunit ribosomal protein L18